MHGSSGARTYTHACTHTQTHARAGTHYAHMTAPNQKTKTITLSIVSHLAFDLRTSIGTFSLQNRACSIYRWHNRVTHRAVAAQKLASNLIFIRTDYSLGYTFAHARAWKPALIRGGISVTYVICEVGRRSREFFVIRFRATIPFVDY